MLVMTPQSTSSPPNVSLQRVYQSVLCEKVGSDRTGSRVRSTLVGTVVDFAPQPTRGAYRSHVKCFDVKLEIQNLRAHSDLAQPAVSSITFGNNENAFDHQWNDESHKHGSA